MKTRLMYSQVNTDEICAAIKLGFNDTRCVLEPAGALAIAGLKKYVQLKVCEAKAFFAHVQS
jgi:threonine dehydratase